jgi:hypothetical protein
MCAAINNVIDPRRDSEPQELLTWGPGNIPYGKSLWKISPFMRARITFLTFRGVGTARAGHRDPDRRRQVLHRPPPTAVAPVRGHWIVVHCAERARVRFFSNVL